MMLDDLSSRVALVVGAGGGFGSVIAQGLAAKGAAVALVGRHAESIDPIAEKIAVSNGRAFVICGDVTDASDVSHIYEKVTQKFGKPTILVDAAAVAGPFGPIGYVDPEQWWASMSVHLKAPLLLANQVLPEMLRIGKGHIIILSSIVGQTVYPHLSAYSVGKLAQASLVAHAAVEHRSSGVCFFAIQPGVAYTKMTEETLASGGFQKWAPDARERIQQYLKTNDDASSLAACAARCCQLVSGKYDVLSGGFLKPEDNLDHLLAEAGS
jgi:NAD(P)-dependent dehydrogenase (short-subunit alcohol dehydrogenase family)